jgi:hypothetical protein
MTPEAQRIAIAEACGWRKLPREDIEMLWPCKEYVTKADVDLNAIGVSQGLVMSPPERSRHGSIPPDYLKDLNAMREAEKKLTEDKWPKYREHLRTAVLGPVRVVSQWCKADIHATAAQRAEAFLRTLNLWNDNL